MQRSITASLFVLAMFLSLPVLLAAQEIASLTGVVSDKTGAVIPDATVSLVDTKTNATYETKTNDVGAYTFVKLLPGPKYKLTISRDGFESLTISNIYLAVGSTHTQNAQLEIGKISQTVEVNGAGAAVTLNTTDATVGSTFDMNLVHELPVLVRDSPAGLLAGQPGVVSADTNSEDGNGSRNGAVTGARADQGNITLDGLDVNDFVIGQSFAMVANAPVDSIQEFRGETANPLAAEGRGSGAQIQLTTKSGSNTWHGAVYAYNRTAATEANSFFNNLNGVPRQPLTRNQFGAAIGGPIKKDKLFFFFNYQGRREAHSDSVEQIVPLDSYRAGEVSYINNGAGCTEFSRRNTQPSCISKFTAAQVAALDPGQDPNTGLPGPNSALLAFVNSRYPHANDLANAGDGVNTGGFRFNAPAHDSPNAYVTRIDYNLSRTMKLFGRVTILRQTTGDDSNFPSTIQFPGDPVTHAIEDHSYAYVIGHTWTLSSNKINQFAYGKTVSDLNFPTLFNPSATLNYQFFGPLSSPFQGQSSQFRKVPVPIFRDDFTYVKGKHTWQMGGFFKPILLTNNLTSDFNDITMGFGGNLANLNTTPPEPSLRPSDILQDPAVDPQGVAVILWDHALLFDLGRYAQVLTNVNYGHDLQQQAQGSPAPRNYRYYETEGYIQDTWRLRNDLTISYGLRYQFYSVPYEVNGLQTISNLGFNQAFDPRVVNGLNGVAGANSLPIAIYSLAGKANHAPGFYSPDYKDFAPRLSFAYNPSFKGSALGRLLGDRKTVIRAGAGIVYDHPATNSIAFFQNQNSFLFSNQTPTLFGGADAITSLQTDPRFKALTTLPPNLNPVPIPTSPFAPFVDSNGVPFGESQNVLAYNFDKNLKTPYSETISFGIQRELPGNFQLEATYFGRFGRRLLAQADAGQLVDFKDPGSGQFMGQAFAAVESQVRGATSITSQPFFENQITGGTSFCQSLGAPSCTAFVAGALNTFLNRGDMGTSVFLLNAFGFFQPGVGFGPQFDYNIYLTNKSASSYNGLLTSLHKKMANGLQFDLNYTYSHSLDNTSAIANNFSGENANFSGGVICDVTHLRLCRGNSEFDATHLISADGIYDLPFGHGRALGGNMTGWLNQIVGGWEVAGIQSWRSGLAYTTVAAAFPFSFNNNVPAIFDGDHGALKTHVHNVNGQIQVFANPVAAIGAFSGPLGFQAGSRDNLRGPRYFNLHLSLNKHFPIREKYVVEFRAEAYNVFNHTDFGLPGIPGFAGTIGSADITQPAQFGVINTTSAAPRQMQFALRLDF